MKVLIVCQDGTNTSVFFKRKLEALSDSHEYTAIAIADIKNYPGYDVVITPKELVKQASAAYSPSKIKLLESFNATVNKAFETWIQQ